MFKNKYLWFFISGLACSSLLFLQGCGKKLDPEPSCNFVQSSLKRRVSWGDKLPVRLYVDASFPRKYFGALKNAIKAWNAKKELLRVEVWGSGGSPDPRRDGFSVIYWKEIWETNRQREQARTTVYWSGDQIFEADVRMNAQDFAFSMETPPDPVSVDLESVLVHELGHVLGLTHKAGKSVMNTELASGVDRRKPSAQDKKDLSCEYM